MWSYLWDQKMELHEATISRKIYLIYFVRLFFSGMAITDPPMQGFTVQRQVGRREPGLQRRTTNHNGFRWIFVKSLK